MKSKVRDDEDPSSDSILFKLLERILSKGDGKPCVPNLTGIELFPFAFLGGVSSRHEVSSQTDFLLLALGLGKTCHGGKDGAT